VCSVHSKDRVSFEIKLFQTAPLPLLVKIEPCVVQMQQCNACALEERKKYNK
jgi:hypothetical protein